MIGIGIGIPSGLRLGGGGGWTPVYLLRDNFVTDEAALASPRACEPGPGQWDAAVVNNRPFIADNLLRFTGTCQNAGIISASGYDRRIGRIFAWRMASNSSINANVRFGLANQATLTGTLQFGWTYVTSGSFVVRIGSTAILSGISIPTTDYVVYIVTGSARTKMFVNNTLIWVYAPNASETLWPEVYNLYASSVNFALAEVSGFDAGYPWDTDWGYATSYAESATANATIAHTADAIIEATWTPSSSEVWELDFRRTDEDNRMIVRCDQANSTIKLYRREAGIETELDPGKTQTFSVGSPKRLVIICKGDAIQTVISDVVRHNTTDSFNATATGAKTDKAVADFAAWPAENTYPFELAPAGARAYFLSVGDSKTHASQYQPTLAVLLAQIEGSYWSDPNELGISGYTVAQMQAVIDDELAVRNYTPTYALLNFGANDVGGTPVEATWKANYLYILDAIHAKWPNCQCYIMRPWRRNYGTECDTLATWIANIVTSRSTFCHLGPDERLFLENGDDGTTYTTDGIHPNTQGYRLVAQEWYTVLNSF